MYDLCVKTQTEGEDINSVCSQHSVRRFFLVQKSDIVREIKSSMLGTVPGSRKIHHLRVIAPNVLETRPNACFCSSCILGVGQCSSSEHAKEWEVVKLKYTGPDSLLNRLQSQSVDQATDQMHVDDAPFECSGQGDSDVPAEMVISDSEEAESESEINDQRFEEDRVSFFLALSDELAVCKSIEEFQECAQRMSDEVEKFPLPQSLANVAGCHIDSTALSLLPQEISTSCLTLSVLGDGNCFFRSLSLLFFGDESHHQELRCRIAMAMAQNPAIFLDGKNWCRKHIDDVTPEEVLKVAVMTSVAPTLPPPQAFEREVISIIQDCSFTGLWEFFEACFVLQYPIQSVFPRLGWNLYQKHCNRIMSSPNCCYDQKLYIMWSSVSNGVVSQEHWVPNHFVPVVLRSRRKNVPQIQSYYIVQWNNKDYVGLVLEVDELLCLGCVSFMSQKGKTKMYSWPENPESSWEPFEAFQQQVQMSFVARFSNWLAQYYTYA